MLFIEAFVSFSVVSKIVLQNGVDYNRLGCLSLETVPFFA
jgi:hypothetical protein